MRVLGVDPGTYTTGFGVVGLDGSALGLLSCGLISTSRNLKTPERLKKMYDGLQEIIFKEKPDVVAIEDVFYGKNFKTAVKIGEVRSLAMLAAVNHNVDVVEYSPARVKEAIVGHGRAAKSQVQKMVAALLGLDKIPEQDAADALATAICHCHTIRQK